MSNSVKHGLSVLAVILLAAVLSSSGLAQAERHVVGPSIPISTLDEIETEPDAAYNSQHDEYLVVWNYWAGGATNINIYAVRITSYGHILNSFTIASGPNAQSSPAVAYDHHLDRYLVIWKYDKNGNGSDYDIMGRFIPWEGVDPGQTEFVINDDPMDQGSADVVYNAHPSWPEFLVVMNDYQASGSWGITGVRVSTNPDGSANTTQFIVADQAPNGRYSPSVGYNLSRNEYLVTYQGTDLTATTGIFATRLEANGNTLDDGDGDPADGDEFEIETGSDMDVTAVTTSCMNQNHYLVVWEKYQTGGHYDLYGRFVSGTGTPDPAFQITNIAVNETGADLACQPDGSHIMVVWEQQYSNTGGPYGVWGRVIFPDGSMGPQRTIEGVVDNAERRWPSVAGKGSAYFVVWSHDRYGTPYKDIHARAFWPFVSLIPLVVR
jgi:hypothetical protein